MGKVVMVARRIRDDHVMHSIPGRAELVATGERVQQSLELEIERKIHILVDGYPEKLSMGGLRKWKALTLSSILTTSVCVLRFSKHGNLKSYSGSGKTGIALLRSLNGDSSSEEIRS
jgi:hypothetical protein